MQTTRTETPYAREEFFVALGVVIVLAFASCGLSGCIKSASASAAPTQLTTNNAAMAAPANPIDLTSSTCSDGAALTFMRSDAHCGVTGTLPLAKLPVPWTASPPDCHGSNQFLKFNNTSHLFTCETASASGILGSFPYRRTIIWQPPMNYSSDGMSSNLFNPPNATGVVGNSTCAPVPNGWPAASGVCTPVTTKTITNSTNSQMGYADNYSGLSAGPPDMAPIVSWIWRTPDAVTTGRRYWAGMINSTNVTASLGAPCSPGPCGRSTWNVAAFAMDPGVSANWLICTADNTNMSCDDTGKAWSATTYMGTIDMSAWGTDGSSAVSWSLADTSSTASGTKNTNKPQRGNAASNSMGPICAALTTDAIHTVTMQCGRMTLVEN